ncbi:hypothetical protein VTK73DRAFT_8112 [Phialemonium thermophilum]|uniref:Uncharacterized protein n=1 Tax=Phialemonium thermophilum TaxID=223376 RepID=A0ABR3WAA5_9PEZI
MWTAISNAFFNGDVPAADDTRVDGEETRGRSKVRRGSSSGSSFSSQGSQSHRPRGEEGGNSRYPDPEPSDPARQAPETSLTNLDLEEPEQFAQQQADASRPPPPSIRLFPSPPTSLFSNFRTEATGLAGLGTPAPQTGPVSKGKEVEKGDDPEEGRAFGRSAQVLSDELADSPDSLGRGGWLKDTDGVSSRQLEASTWAQPPPRRAVSAHRRPDSVGPKSRTEFLRPERRAKSLTPHGYPRISFRGSLPLLDESGVDASDPAKNTQKQLHIPAESEWDDDGDLVYSPPSVEYDENRRSPEASVPQGHGQQLWDSLQDLPPEDRLSGLLEAYDELLARSRESDYDLLRANKRLRKLLSDPREKEIERLKAELEHLRAERSSADNKISSVELNEQILSEKARSERGTVTSLWRGAVSTLYSVPGTASRPAKLSAMRAPATEENPAVENTQDDSSASESANSVRVRMREALQTGRLGSSEPASSDMPPSRRTTEIHKGDGASEATAQVTATTTATETELGTPKSESPSQPTGGERATTESLEQALSDKDQLKRLRETVRELHNVRMEDAATAERIRKEETQALQKQIDGLKRKRDVLSQQMHQGHLQSQKQAKDSLWAIEHLQKKIAARDAQIKALDEKIAVLEQRLKEATARQSRIDSLAEEVKRLNAGAKERTRAYQKQVETLDRQLALWDARAAQLEEEVEILTASERAALEEIDILRQELRMTDKRPGGPPSSNGSTEPMIASSRPSLPQHTCHGTTCFCTLLLYFIPDIRFARFLWAEDCCDCHTANGQRLYGAGVAKGESAKAVGRTSGEQLARSHSETQNGTLPTATAVTAQSTSHNRSDGCKCACHFRDDHTARGPENKRDGRRLLGHGHGASPFEGGGATQVVCQLLTALLWLVLLILTQPFNIWRLLVLGASCSSLLSYYARVAVRYVRTVCYASPAGKEVRQVRSDVEEADSQGSLCANTTVFESPTPPDLHIPSAATIVGGLVSLFVVFTWLMFMAVALERHTWVHDNAWAASYLHNIMGINPYPGWSPCAVDFRLLLPLRWIQETAHWVVFPQRRPTMGW